jgi:hypothetical protein
MPGLEGERSLVVDARSLLCGPRSCIAVCGRVRQCNAHGYVVGRDTR